MALTPGSARTTRAEGATTQRSGTQGGRHLLLHDDETNGDDEADGNDDGDGGAHVRAVRGQQRLGAHPAALRAHEGRLRALEHGAQPSSNPAAWPRWLARAV